MADVDMTDAPTTSLAKKAKSGEVEAKGEGKKRFEVKKVRVSCCSIWLCPVHLGNG